MSLYNYSIGSLTCECLLDSADPPYIHVLTCNCIYYRVEQADKEVGQKGTRIQVGRIPAQS